MIDIIEQIDLKNIKISSDLDSGLFVEQKKTNMSDRLQEYKSFMGDLFSECLLKQTSISGFQHNRVYFVPQGKFIENMKVDLLSQSTHSEISFIRASWGHFIVDMIMLKINKESLAHHNSSSRGGFGQIYFEKYEEFSPVKQVTKCMKYKKFKSKRYAIIFAIREYFLAKIASVLKVGPYLPNALKVDLILYETCVQFSMERCSSNYLGPLQSLEYTMKQNLLTLHTYNFLHFDIKPENIMYSLYFQKPVFIDFGLSEIRAQFLGQRSYIGFKGTVTYSSEQMLVSFYSTQKEWIDAYYHDCSCLKLSLIDLKNITQKRQMQDTQQKQQVNLQIKYQSLKRVEQYLIFIKSNLFAQNVGFLSKFFAKHRNMIRSHLMNEIIDFFVELDPTPPIIAFYQEIKNSEKEGFRFAQISKFKHKKLFDIETYKDYAQKHEWLLVYNQQSIIEHFQGFGDQYMVQSQKITKESMINLLTSDNSVLKTSQKYFVVFTKFISFTNNIHGVTAEERQIVCIYCTKNILKIDISQDIHPLQQINACIINILWWYCQHSDYDTPNEKWEQLTTIYDLVEHLFILGRTQAAIIVSILNQLEANYFWSLEEKMQLLLNVRLFIDWILERFLKTILNWCYLTYDELIKGVSAKYLPFFNFLKFLLPCTTNKNYLSFFSTVNIEQLLIFQRKFNNRIMLSIKLISVQITSYWPGDDLLEFIYSLISLEQRNRIFPWTAKLYWYTYSQFYFEKSLKIYILFAHNMGNTGIAHQFFISDAQLVLQAQLNNFAYFDLTYHFLSKIHLDFILTRSRFIGVILLELVFLVQRTINKDQIQKDRIKQSLSRITQYWPQLTVIPETINAAHHVCVSYAFIANTMNIKTRYFYLLGIQEERLLEDIEEVRKKGLKSSCQNCQLIIEIQYRQLLNHFIFMSQTEDIGLYQQQYISRHKSIEQLLKGVSLNMRNNFTSNNCFNLAHFCIISRQLEDRYGGVRDFYYHLKATKSLHRYLVDQLVNKILTVTLEIVLKNSMQEFAYFINAISLFAKEQYSRYYYLFFIKLSVEFMRMSNIDYHSLFIQLQKMKCTDKAHLFLFYNKISFFFIRNKLPFAEVERAKKKMHIYYDRCSYQIKSFFNVYEYSICQCLVYNNTPERQIRHLIRKSFKMASVSQPSLTSLRKYFKRKGMAAKDEWKFKLLEVKHCKVGPIIKTIKDLLKYIPLQKL